LRILIITNLFSTERHPGGGTFISQRVDAHRKMGNSVQVVCVATTITQPLAWILSAFDRGSTRQLQPPMHLEIPAVVPLLDRLHPKFLPYPRLNRMAAVVDRLHQITDPTAFDVIHAHGMYAVPAGAVASHVSAKSGTPYVITAHGSDINVLMPHRAKEYASVLDSAGAVLYVSGALRERAHVLGAKGRNAWVIPNGVNCDLFHPAATPTRGFTEFPLVLYVGNLAHVKGADRLPAIFEGIAAALPGARFIVAGDGPMRGAIEGAVNRDNTTLLGQVAPERVPELMKMADLMVLPSRNEGWPCVVLEAYACGTRVLGSDAGGIPEVISDSRFVVAGGPALIERFVDAAVAVLRSPADVGRLRSRALGYTWSAIVRRETEVLGEVVSSRRL